MRAVQQLQRALPPVKKHQEWREIPNRDPDGNAAGRCRARTVGRAHARRWTGAADQ